MITTFALLIFFFNLYQQHANYGLICVRLLFFLKFLFHTNTIIITFICKCIKYLYSFNQGLLFQIKTHSVYLIPAPPHISQPAARPHARTPATPHRHSFGAHSERPGNRAAFRSAAVGSGRG